MSFFFLPLCKSQGRRISWGSTTYRGWEIRFCAMIQRWRRGKAGCLWVTWKAAYTTKLVRSFFFFFFPLKSCLIVLLHLVTPAFFFSCISKLYQDCFETCLLNMMDALALVIPDCTWCYGYVLWRLEERSASPVPLLSQGFRNSVVT